MTALEKFMADLPEEDKAALTAALRQWRDEGVEDPRIPINADIDGDGVTDSFTLDADGNLAVVLGIDVSTTVSEADGTGLETGGE